jgi:hypothetical protein
LSTSLCPPYGLALLILKSDVIAFQEVGFPLILLGSYVFDRLLFTAREEVFGDSQAIPAAALRRLGQFSYAGGKSYQGLR